MDPHIEAAKLLRGRMAARRACWVWELVEPVLTNLNNVDLVAFGRVCRLWRMLQRDQLRYWRFRLLWAWFRRWLGRVLVERVS